MTTFHPPPRPPRKSLEPNPFRRHLPNLNHIHEIHAPAPHPKHRHDDHTGHERTTFQSYIRRSKQEKQNTQQPNQDSKLRPSQASQGSVDIDENAHGKKGFIRLDPVVFFITVAYLLAFCAFTFASWCYLQDSNWNDIVHGSGSLPNLPEEEFFSGKALHFNSRDRNLELASKHLLRESRSLELIHILYFGSYLLVGLCHCAAFVTRGKEDYSKIVIGLYVMYGTLGMFVAFFPLLSWNIQQNDYKLSYQHLNNFAKKVFATPEYLWENDVNNATAHDALLIAKVMKFCSTASDSVISLSEDTHYIAIYNRKYTLPEFQTLGFCTYHKYKIAVTVISFIFAFVCCCIPCVYLVEDKLAQNKVDTEKPGEEKFQARQSQPKESPPPKMVVKVSPSPKVVVNKSPPQKLLPMERENTDKTPVTEFHQKEPQAKVKESPYRKSDGSKLTEQESYFVHKWKDFILQDSD